MSHLPQKPRGQLVRDGKRRMLGREEDEAQSVVDHLGPLGRRRLGATASLAVPAAQDRSLGGTQHLRGGSGGGPGWAAQSGDAARRVGSNAL